MKIRPSCWSRSWDIFFSSFHHPKSEFFTQSCSPYFCGDVSMISAIWFERKLIADWSIDWVKIPDIAIKKFIIQGLQKSAIQNQIFSHNHLLHILMVMCGEYKQCLLVGLSRNGLNFTNFLPEQANKLTQRWRTLHLIDSSVTTRGFWKSQDKMLKEIPFWWWKIQKLS